MEQKSILITGCSSGIGRCLADGLRQRGYRVFATARKSGDVTQLLADGFEALPLDLDSPQSIRDAVETVLNRTQGKLYALINNGAYGQPGAVEDLSRDKAYEFAFVVQPLKIKGGTGSTVAPIAIR